MDQRISMGLRTLAAALYWLLYFALFFGLQYSDDEGGIPLLILGLPWSIPVEFIAYVASSLFPSLERFMVTMAGNFLTLVVICGSINAVLILGWSRVGCWLRRSPQYLAICAAIGVGLVACVQLASPMIEGDALERSRPRNVPHQAVHVVGVRGVWQSCTYSSARNVNLCQIWNRGGLILAEGEFVPYDGGDPVVTDQLEIKTDNGMPQTIALRNGRILIEKAREADMRRSLDSLSKRH